MRVAVASGKGGTGKTTVAVNLAWCRPQPIQLLDCDVEEPNAHLFLGATPDIAEIVSIPVPLIDPQLCDGCGACSRFCQYRAIAAVAVPPLVFPELCHGCGGCTLICPRKAVSETGRRIGTVAIAHSGHVTLVQGTLDVGAALAPPLIRAVKSHIPSSDDVILDAPPGTSCPVVTTLRGVDAIVMMTEPTPFGLHDLTLAVDMVRPLGIPCGVVINRDGSGDERVTRFCIDTGLPILARIPDDRRIAEAYSAGRIVVDALPEYLPLFHDLWQRLTVWSTAAPRSPHAHV